MKEYFNLNVEEKKTLADKNNRKPDYFVNPEQTTTTTTTITPE